MRRKQVGFLVALVAVGLVGLTACGEGAAQTGGPVVTHQEAPRTQDVDPAVMEFLSGVDFLKGTNLSVKANQVTGDKAPVGAAPEVRAKWIELRAAEAGGLEPAVVNGNGRAVYWFADDPVGTKTSACDSECAKTWPPVVLNQGGKVIFSGVRKDRVGFIQRADGRKQVTLGGRPLHLFAGDGKRGDILGQGIGGKWFVIDPEGRRAVASGQDTAQPAPATGAVGPASVVTFFTGRNFDDFSGDNFATGVRVERTCQDLRGAFRSLTTDGAVKIWSEPGCTGKSAVVSEDVRDAAALGFPAGVKSYLRA